MWAGPKHLLVWCRVSRFHAHKNVAGVQISMDEIVNLAQTKVVNKTYDFRLGSDKV
jgi:hypothetical protein